MRGFPKLELNVGGIRLVECEKNILSGGRQISFLPPTNIYLAAAGKIMWRPYKYLAAASDLRDFQIFIWLSADKIGIIYYYAHALDVNRYLLYFLLQNATFWYKIKTLWLNLPGGNAVIWSYRSRSKYQKIKTNRYLTNFNMHDVSLKF